ncbi:hypothetical protein EJ06DRAFT_505822 [Trichodelitschia bisporula]|uniref:AB hydrolase-1 domain-containing protein n=1 Tax=Trichodelitschia bisporula TaxID=703511 RepID=A0A6G1I3X2_9PEZI|nr:hypothetical protein EJ06DRAFT_505822 [Trichodelitschia bisporula]
MPPLHPLLKKGLWAIPILSASYITFLLILTIPTVQRLALYAHPIHTGYWDDINVPEYWGFAPGQVTPFTISTPDGETLYGWHILPLDVYAAHADVLAANPPRTPEPFNSTFAAKLLSSDPSSRVIVNFHGNAGHVAQSHRPPTYKLLTALPHTHLLSLSYRGFAHSTGFPSEKGLITDATTLLSATLSLVPANRILLLGQSLGTAVAAAAALHFDDPAAAAKYLDSPAPPHPPPPVRFASVILVASFPSLPTLLLTYRAGGLVPFLAPLARWPGLQALAAKGIHEVWPTGLRVAALVAGMAARGEGGTPVRVLHARDDADIGCGRSGEVLDAVVEGAREQGLVVVDERGEEGGEVFVGGVRVKLDIVKFGGEYACAGCGMWLMRQGIIGLWLMRRLCWR